MSQHSHSNRQISYFSYKPIPAHEQSRKNLMFKLALTVNFSVSVLEHYGNEVKLQYPSLGIGENKTKQR